MSEQALPYPPCVCGHRYDRHTDSGDPRKIGCHRCDCKEYRAAEVLGPKIIPSVPLPTYPVGDGGNALLIGKESHATWLAYHLALDFVEFSVSPLGDAWEFTVMGNERGLALLRRRASAYFHDGKEL